MHDAALVVFSAVACVLLLLPVSIHIRARNYPMVFNVMWLFLFNLNLFINFTHWWDSYADDLPGFCDIAIKLSAGMSTGLSASSLCLNKRLAFIATSRNVTLNERRRRLLVVIDVTLCAFLPMVVMALSYIPQTQRYSIWEGQGCVASYWTSAPAIIILYGLPVILEWISICFGVIAIRAFLRRRLQFHSILRNSQSGITPGQYLRLIAMASADLLLAMPLNIAYLVKVSRKAIAWTSWDDIHANFSYVNKLPAQGFDLVFTDYGSTVLLLLAYWLGPLLAFIFFIFFGVTDEAIREYTHWWTYASSLVPRKQSRNAQLIQPPRLGTTIQRADSLDLQTTHTGGDTDAEKGFSGLQTVQELDHKIKAGLAVSVQVDRRIV